MTRITTRSRRGLLALMSGVALGLAGCAAPLAPEKSRPAALRELGFTPNDEGWALDLASRLTFAVDDASPSAEGLASLTRIARVLLGIGIDKVTVEGHADNQGDTAYNRRLSDRRATAVAWALVERGFEWDNIVRRGYGATRPIADNASDIGRLQNRRAVLIVSAT